MAYDAHGNRARAVHTDRPTLATAAHMDWSAELRRLHKLRHGREVLLHWCHAVEIQHFPRTLTGYPSCQVSSRRCGSQRVWPRTALAVRRGGVGSSSRGSGLLPDGMCWWRLVYPRRRHGLESVLAPHTCHLGRCVRLPPALRSTMWR